MTCDTHRALSIRQRERLLHAASTALPTLLALADTEEDRRAILDLAGEVSDLTAHPSWAETRSRDPELYSKTFAAAATDTFAMLAMIHGFGWSICQSPAHATGLLVEAPPAVPGTVLCAGCLFEQAGYEITVGGALPAIVQAGGEMAAATAQAGAGA